MSDDLTSPRVSKFRLTYSGDIERGGLEAHEVASAIDGFSRLLVYLIEHSGGVPDRRQIKIYVPSVARGSAVIDFIVQVTGFVQPVFGPLAGVFSSFKSVQEVLGACLQLAEFLGGKPPHRVVRQRGTNNVSIENTNGETVIAPIVIEQLTINQYFGAQAEKFVKPIRRRKRSLGIDADGARIKSINQIGSSSYVPISANQNLPTAIREGEALLRVKSPVLEGDGVWRFLSGRNVITATIADEFFLDAVNRGDESFARGDVFRVRLRTEQFALGSKVQTKHYIDEIIERVPR
jgi:hypothetical protein